MLTDKRVATVKPHRTRRIELRDTLPGVPGLALRVNIGGTKTWVLRYRVGAGGRRAQQRRLTLGEYPELRLAKARKEAAAHLIAVRDGADPAGAKQEARAAETFGELATEYLDRHAKPHKRSWGEDARMLDKDILPAWRHRKVREITRRDVRALLETIAGRGAPTAANRTWALLSTLFNFAIRRDWLEANPASLIERQPETSRDRVLSHDELRALWPALEAAGRIEADRPATKADAPVVSPMIARGLQMLLLTAQRPGEVFSVKWADLELPDDWATNDQAVGWWTIPETVSKNKQAHRVPLSPAVIPILRDAWATAPDHNPYVFGGTKGGSVGARAKKAAAALSARLGFAFHRHDLRRTAASEMAAAGISRDTIAKCLNHIDRGPRATAIYDRYSYDAEKRIALETWARRLTGILEAKPAAVVPFARA